MKLTWVYFWCKSGKGTYTKDEWSGYYIHPVSRESLKEEHKRWCNEIAGCGYVIDGGFCIVRKPTKEFIKKHMSVVEYNLESNKMILRMMKKDFKEAK